MTVGAIRAVRPSPRRRAAPLAVLMNDDGRRSCCSSCPIIIIELGLIVFALRDLLRPERRVRGDSKLIWGLLIVFVGMLGPILYLAVGREEE